MASPIEQQLTELFHEAGAAHHQAFAGTNGEDPEWPVWYAQYLAPRLQQIAGRAFEVQQVAADLKAMHSAHQGRAGQRPWPDYYAQCFRERYSL